MDWLTRGILKAPLGDDARRVLGDSDEAREAIEELEASRVKAKSSEDLLHALVLKAQQAKPVQPVSKLWAALAAELERKRQERIEAGRKQAVAERKFWATFKQGGK